MPRAGFRVPVFATTLQRYNFFPNPQWVGVKKSKIFSIFSKKNRIYLEGKDYRLIVTTEWYGEKKQLLLTAFDLRPISRKNPQRAREMRKAPKR